MSIIIVEKAKGMKNMKFSNHLRNDRADRINFILNTVGFGKIIKMVSAARDNRPAWRGITNTGIMVVTDESKTTIITMWIASTKQLEKIYAEEVVPEVLYKRVRANEIYQLDQKMLG